MGVVAAVADVISPVHVNDVEDVEEVGKTLIYILRALF